MSSFNIDTEVSGEELRKLTMQWHYNTPSGRTSKQERRERTPFEIPSFISSAVNFCCILAGASTTVAVTIAVMEGWIDTSKLTALLF